MKKKILSIILVVLCIISATIIYLNAEGKRPPMPDSVKSEYLNNVDFNLYDSGVLSAKVKFTNNKVMVSLVDPKTRIQEKEAELGKVKIKTSLLDDLKENLSNYSQCNWNGDKTILEDGKRYNRYEVITGEIDGEEVEAYLWVNRNSDKYIDVVTLNNKVIAFIIPGRLKMTYLVRDGYEDITPLIKYEDELMSKPEYGIDSLKNQWVDMRDGVRLATDVYLPYSGQKNEKYPTIVIRTCYGKNGMITNTAHWVNRGYAVVVQDVRGRGDSDGELVPFNNEREDANDLFDWIIDQEWSDGNIGMWGASYLGYTATSGATTGHPNLKTVISEVNVGSAFEDVVRRNGAVCSDSILTWLLPQSVGNSIDKSVMEDYKKNIQYLKSTCLEDIPQKMAGINSEVWDEWGEHYYYDDYWKQGDNSFYGENIKIPMLIMSGWFDGDARGVAETWNILTENDVEGRRIVLGPWTHLLNSTREIGSLEFGDNAIDYDFDTRIIRWFDRYLKGIENGEDKKPRATYYVMGENQWRTSDDWNPVESELTSFYFSSDGNANSMGNGQLVSEPANEVIYDTYVYDPKHPINMNNIKEIFLRKDVLVYDSESLSEDITIAGNMFTEFYASTSAVDTDFIVRISDIDEDGNVVKISNNVMRAEFRKGKDKPELMIPNKVEKFEFSLPYYGYVFKKGHKIRVDISSSNCSQYFPNSNTGVNPYENVEPIIATNKIYHGEKYPSCIKLPVIPNKEK